MARAIIALGLFVVALFAISSAGKKNGGNQIVEQDFIDIDLKHGKCTARTCCPKIIVSKNAHWILIIYSSSTKFFHNNARATIKCRSRHHRVVSLGTTGEVVHGNSVVAICNGKTTNWFINGVAITSVYCRPTCRRGICCPPLINSQLSGAFAVQIKYSHSLQNFLYPHGTTAHVECKVSQWFTLFLAGGTHRSFRRSGGILKCTRQGIWIAGRYRDVTKVSCRPVCNPFTCCPAVTLKYRATPRPLDEGESEDEDEGTAAAEGEDAAAADEQFEEFVTDDGEPIEDDEQKDEDALPALTEHTKIEGEALFAESNFINEENDLTDYQDIAPGDAPALAEGESPPEPLGDPVKIPEDVLEADKAAAAEEEAEAAENDGEDEFPLYDESTLPKDETPLESEAELADIEEVEVESEDDIDFGEGGDSGEVPPAASEGESEEVSEEDEGESAPVDDGGDSGDSGEPAPEPAEDDGSIDTPAPEEEVPAETEAEVQGGEGGEEEEEADVDSGEVAEPAESEVETQQNNFMSVYFDSPVEDEAPASDEESEELPEGAQSGEGEPAEDSGKQSSTALAYFLDRYLRPKLRYRPNRSFYGLYNPGTKALLKCLRPNYILVSWPNHYVLGPKRAAVCDAVSHSWKVGDYTMESVGCLPVCNNLDTLYRTGFTQSQNPSVAVYTNAASDGTLIGGTWGVTQCAAAGYKLAVKAWYFYRCGYYCKKGKIRCCRRRRVIAHIDGQARFLCWKRWWYLRVFKKHRRSFLRVIKISCVSKWTPTEFACIEGNNHAQLTIPAHIGNLDAMLQYCKASCEAHEQCVSIELHQRARRCNLAKVNKATAFPAYSQPCHRKGTIYAELKHRKPTGACPYGTFAMGKRITTRWLRLCPNFVTYHPTKRTPRQCQWECQENLADCIGYIFDLRTSRCYTYSLTKLGAAPYCACGLSKQSYNINCGRRRRVCKTVRFCRYVRCPRYIRCLGNCKWLFRKCLRRCKGNKHCISTCKRRFIACRRRCKLCHICGYRKKCYYTFWACYVGSPMCRCWNFGRINKGGSALKALLSCKKPKIQNCSRWIPFQFKHFFRYHSYCAAH